MANRKRLLLIAAAVLTAAVLTAAYLNVRTPRRIEDVKAEATGSELTVSWKKSFGADGYFIYAYEEDGLKKVGETNGNQSGFTLTDYDRDSGAGYRVTAYIDVPLIHRFREGNLSDAAYPDGKGPENAWWIPVLAYHNITSGKADPDDGLLISQDEFDAQMKYLHDNGFKTLTLDEFRQWHEGSLEVPVKSVVVTFDDGYYGTYYCAYPVIRKYGQAATVFCVGKKIGDTTEPFDPDELYSRFLGRDVIGEVRRDYPAFSFESHTHHMHSRIDGRKPVNVMSYDEMLEDFRDNEEFGFSYLAYPWGEYNDDLIRAARESGYGMAFAYEPSRYANRSDDAFKVGRVKIGSYYDMDYFINIVNGNVKKFYGEEWND